MTEIKQLEAQVEAILFTMGEAVELERIAAAVEHDEDTVRRVIRNMMDRYEEEGHGIHIIELDGSQHYEPQGMVYDEGRSAFLLALGLEVLRFSNRDIDRDFRGVCEQIDLTIQKRLRAPLSHLW